MKKFLTFAGISIGLCALMTVPVLAADVFDAAKTLTNDAANTIRTLSTPAALIGVGTGAFMKKLSMGDHQKVAMGNKVFWGSIIGWGTINGLTLILNTVQHYIS